MARRKPTKRDIPVFNSDGSDFEDWVSSMPPTFMACRDVGHVWRALTARWDDELYCFIRTWRCTRCRTDRTQVLLRNGAVDKTQYTYEEGYNAPRGIGRMDRDAKSTVRLAATLQLLSNPESFQQGTQG